MESELLIKLNKVTELIKTFDGLSANQAAHKENAGGNITLLSIHEGKRAAYQDCAIRLRAAMTV